MAITHPRLLARSISWPGALDATLALLGVVLLGAMTLLTSAFTDFESEALPGITAFLNGHLVGGLRVLPIYGGSVLAEAPLAAVAKLLGGGDLAIYRAVAIPGALGIAWCATLAARWLRESGLRRRDQLLALGAIALSPCVALAWTPGHPEEGLVTTVAVAGLLLVMRGGSRTTVAGGVLMGLASAGKQWALLLLPLGLACSPDGRRAIQFAASSGLAALALGLPVLAPQVATYVAVAKTSGGGGVFTIGNMWWWTGRVNPHYNGGSFGTNHTFEQFTSDNSARLGPAFVQAHAHQLIVLISLVLAAAWWWRVGRDYNAAASAAHRRDASSGQGSGRIDQRHVRVGSVLLLAAAIMFWRAFADPWFQAYYLLPAMTLVVLADARMGRLPVAGLLGWVIIWLTYGQNAPHMGLDADGTTALRQAFLVPFGLWITTRALRPAR